MATDSLLVSEQERAPNTKITSFDNHILEMLSHHLLHSTQGHNKKEAGIIGSHIRGCTALLIMLMEPNYFP